MEAKIWDYEVVLNRIQVQLNDQFHNFVRGELISQRGTSYGTLRRYERCVAVALCIFLHHGRYVECLWLDIQRSIRMNPYLFHNGSNVLDPHIAYLKWGRHSFYYWQKFDVYKVWIGAVVNRWFCSCTPESTEIVQWGVKDNPIWSTFVRPNKLNSLDKRRWTSSLPVGAMFIQRQVVLMSLTAASIEETSFFSSSHYGFLK